MTDQATITTPEIQEVVETVENNTQISAPEEEKIITETIDEIARVYQETSNSLMLQIGLIILKNIFEDDTQAAQDIENQKSKSSKRVLFDKLIKEIERLHETGKAPKKTWLYNAVNIAIQQRKLQDIPDYDKLSISHKIELISVKDEETQKQLIEKINSENLTIRATREAIQETREPVVIEEKVPTVMSMIRKPNPDVDLNSLKYFGGKQRDKAIKKIADSTDRINEEIAQKKKELKVLKDIEKKLSSFSKNKNKK